MMRRCVTLSLLAALTSGCSTTRTMDDIMASWIGAPTSEVVARWGYPPTVIERPDGQILVWESIKSRDGIVVEAHWLGNDCPASTWTGPPSTWRR
jgi:hypothetical protein